MMASRLVVAMNAKKTVRGAPRIALVRQQWRQTSSGDGDV
jgi:hypothetical protein